MAPDDPHLQISVVIPTHGRARGLRRLMQSLAWQDYPRNRFEVLVISNFADDACERLVADASADGVQARYLVSGSLGVNRARNLGLDHARGSIVYFLDDDCSLPRADHLARLAAGHDADAIHAIQGGLYADARSGNSAARAYNALANAWVQGQGARPVHLGGNFSVRGSAIGMERFDTDIVYGGSEIGFQMRLHARGVLSKLREDIAVTHRFEGRWNDLLRKAWLQGRRKSRVSPSSAPATLARLPLRVLGFGLGYGAVVQLGRMSAALSRTVFLGGDRQRLSK